ncbi:MAG: DNA mismatch repair endonuclease MutL [Desulfobacteraceae bacterium]|nr:MAG: DNA mismatch repair endonuclease MutL [Desulfobacteraceae bacterium]
MSRIKILPEILSNKIAAGEVVERPASVVKELVENAIDAGSTKITVDINQGGRSLIRISDNGSGMSHDEALLSIERYATSKILTEDDLYAIKTLGFRGEALPSIASVSKFTLVTKDRDSLAGTEIYIEGGRIKKVSDTGASQGTMITVDHLFFNTPARRKFLKTVTTEMGHIADVVSCQALSRPDVHFRLTHNGKEVLNWPAVQTPILRVAHVLGSDLESSLYPLDFQNDTLTLSGWTSDPSVTRGTSQKIHLFVNGRLIHDRGLQYALFEGYRGRILKGRFPVAVLFVTLAPDQVDVNVHPAKNEVRFASQQQVYESVRTAVSGIWKTPPQASPKPSSALPWPDAQTPAERTAPAVQEPLNFAYGSPSGPDPERFPIPPRPNPDTINPHPQETERSLSGFSSAPEPIEPASAQPMPTEWTLPEPLPSKFPKAQQTGLWAAKKFADATVIGQFNNTYILCEGDGELILVDQHAAHERIAFERLKAARFTHQSPMQKLMMPETFDLGYRETAVILQMLGDLNAIGLEIEHFGGNTFVVKSVPALLADREIKPLIVEISEAMTAYGYSPGLEDALDQCLILMACHSAIRARQPLSPREMKELLIQLDRCDNPHHCPHGRPTSIRWPLSFLEKNFKRTL